MTATLTPAPARGEIHDLIHRQSTQSLVLAGNERIQDLVRQSTLAIRDVLSEVRETIARCEAELCVSEEISVVLERDRAVFNVKREFRFAKDKC